MLTIILAFERDSDESNTFAPSGHSQAPQNGLLLQKDKLIESLRLELAEAQIRLAEADHLGGSKVQQIEQQLLDVRMTNARLMEDNESFQLLLSSAALNGEFPRGDYLSNAFSDLEPEMNDAKKVQGSPRNSLSLNLAEELNEVEEEDTEKLKKVETELKSLKEQNKAMSLYISGIIERILQHKDSEAILDKTISLAGPEKPLTPTLTSMPENSVIGVNSAIGVHRTRSLAQRRIPPPFRPENMPGALQRSQSYRGPGGGHKRSQSDVGHIFTGAPGAPGAPGVSGVNNIYRGEGSITPRASFYGNEHYSRSRPRDSSASVDSGVSDTSSINSHSYPSTPIGPITGNKLRPLSLVQKNVNNGMMSPTGSRRISGDYMDHDDSRFDKRSNKRNSWYVPFASPREQNPNTDILTRMGWFNRKEDMPGGIAESVVFEGKDVE